MKIKRRVFLTTLIGLAVSLPIVRKLFVSGNGNRDPQAVFSALIDIFIPADEFAGAIDLKIDVELMTKIQANQAYWDSVVVYLNEIDALSEEAYKTGFEEASLAQRTSLISTLLTDKSGQDLRLQLITLRNQTFTHFYTSQSAFDMLAYHPPSQGGYPDYDRPV